MRVLAMILFLIILSSCGKTDSGAGSGLNGPSGNISQNETIRADGSNINGIYSTELYPINFNLHFKKVGTAAVQRDGDAFSAHVKLAYGPRETRVKQAIYTGRRCPNLNDDLNKDAYIDINEALIAIGSISIPLDGDLDSQRAGADQLPVGDAVTGKYSYDATGSFARMFADLKLPDEDATDNMIKLGAEDGLTFPGRIVLLTGVPEGLFLPPTVATVEGQSVHSSLPLACGVLWKVDALPSL